MREIEYIVLHCTASPQTQTVSEIQNYWSKVLGWKAPGYHHLISADGKDHNIYPIDKISNGVAGYNSKSIHIGYIGGVDKSGKPVDNRTPAQIKTQIDLLVKYITMFPKAKIQGHRDFPNVTKACPSFDVKSWLKCVGLGK